MTRTARLLLAAAFLAGAVFPLQASAEIWTLNAGPVTQRLLDREKEEDTTWFGLLAAVSFQSPRWHASLDFQGRWDTREKDFDEGVWNRRGDFLRPLETLVYTRPEKGFSAGFERLSGWTPGGGYLVRELIGYGEIDYVLPGFLVRWENSDLRVEAGIDRPVDPTVQAAALTWEPAGKVRFTLEGTVDPEAPEAFTGDFSGGRPQADSSRRLSGAAAGFLFPLRDGQVLDLSAGGHTARLGGDASGLGWEVDVSLDLSSYYLNRLSLGFGSVRCTGGYVPAWFEAAYPLRRWGLSGQTLLEAFPLENGQEDRRMEMFDLKYELGIALKVTGGVDRFTDDSMTRGRLFFEIMDPGGRGLEAGLWSQTDGPDQELFTEEADLYSRIGALYAFMPHMLLTVSYDRSWAFREEEAGLVPLTSIVLGVMYNLSL